MASRHLLPVPAHELSVLLSAAENPQFVPLFAQLPAFRLSLLNPIADELRLLASGALDAVREVRANTNYPEDWDTVEAVATRMREGHEHLRLLHDTLPAPEVTPEVTPEVDPEVDPLDAPADDGPHAVCACGGHRFASVMSKACNANWFNLPHLKFETDYTYMPSGMGIPGDGDGPNLAVCLDCGRVQGGEYPLSDNELRRRIDKYNAECL